MNMNVINKLKIKILTAAAVLMVIAGATEVAAQSMSIYEIQSLFLYNFTKHVKWTNQSAKFTVGIYGNAGAYKAIKDNLGNKSESTRK